MIAWLKNLFKNPKIILKAAVDALSLAVPYLSTEIDKIDTKFKNMNSTEKALWIVEKTQTWLRDWLKLNAPIV